MNVIQNNNQLNELLKRLPKSDKEIIQEAKTERLTELHKLISEELEKRSNPDWEVSINVGCKNENCDFEKERYGNCRCEGGMGKYESKVHV